MMDQKIIMLLLKIKNFKVDNIILKLKEKKIEDFKNISIINLVSTGCLSWKIELLKRGRNKDIAFEKRQAIFLFKPIS